MKEYIGLDVSLKETAVSIRCDGKRVWRGKCASDPKVIAELVRKRAPAVERIVFETGPLSVWFYHVLVQERLPAICIDARHAAGALEMAPNKTDANDADGLAQLAEIGYFKAVRVKGFDSMLTRALITVRISRRGDKHLRGLLYEAAVVILTRSFAQSGLRTWGLKLKDRIGFKRAATALARKLAVTMHAMLKSGEFFNPSIGAAA